MIILGVDPGTNVTGYGVIEAEHRRLRMIDFGHIRNSPSGTLPVKLKKIHAKILEVIDTFKPDEFAIEEAFYSENIQTTMKLGHARGVVILAAVNREIPTAEYSAREVKLAVVGNGAASKGQVQFMVKNILQLKEAPTPDDAADALAVAICHSQRRMKLK